MGGRPARTAGAAFKGAEHRSGPLFFILRVPPDAGRFRGGSAVRGGASATMNYMPGTASLIQDIDSECDRGSVGTAGNEG